MAVANPLKLLNISGIGNAKDLKDANIECKLNSEVRVSRTVSGIQSLDCLEISFGNPFKALAIIYRITCSMNTWQNARNP